MSGKKEKELVRAEALFRRGTELLRKGNPEKAIELLEQAYRIDHDNAHLGLNLSGAYILRGQFGLAIPILEQLLLDDVDNPMIWINLGAAYLGNPILATDELQRKAINAFEHALVLDPVAPNVSYNIGLIYRDRQEYEQAINWFQKAIQANPNDRDARSWISKLEQKLENNMKGS